MTYISTQWEYRIRNSGKVIWMILIKKEELHRQMCLWNQVKLFPNCKTFQGLRYANMDQNPSHKGHLMQNFPNVMDFLKLLPTDYLKELIFLWRYFDMFSHNLRKYIHYSETLSRSSIWLKFHELGENYVYWNPNDLRICLSPNSIWEMGVFKGIDFQILNFFISTLNMYVYVHVCVYMYIHVCACIHAYT